MTTKTRSRKRSTNEQIVRRALASFDLSKEPLESLPDDPFDAAFEVVRNLNLASYNFVFDLDPDALKNRAVRRDVVTGLLVFFGLLSMAEERFTSDVQMQLARLYDCNGVEFQGWYAASFVELAFDFASTLAEYVAKGSKERTVDGCLHRQLDIAACVRRWKTIRLALQALPRIDLLQLNNRIDIEQLKWSSKQRDKLVKGKRKGKQTDTSKNDKVDAVRKQFADNPKIKRAILRKNLKDQGITIGNDTIARIKREEKLQSPR